MVRLVIFILSVALTSAPVPAQDIAITFDDLPYVLPSRTSPEQGLAQVEAILRTLEDRGVVATGFAVGRQLNRRSRPALAAFAAAGHRIGNHSWSHPDYGTLTPRAFRRETARADQRLDRWLGARPRLYRFPFLREGPTEAAKTAAEDILTQLGYINVPVTIDTDDWRFNADYLAARDAGDAAAAQSVAEAYLEHIRERSLHFRDMARRHIGRDVAHILLLHMNQINADHLGALLTWYHDTEWTFVPAEEALSDPIYSAPDLYAGPRGVSQIERVLGLPRH